VAYKGNSRLTKEFIRALTKAIRDEKTTVSALARDCDLSRVHIYRLMRGEQSPSLTTAKKILKQIGLKITIESQSRK